MTTKTTSNGIVSVASSLRERGYGIARLTPGEKNPTYPRWTFFSLEPEDFRDGDNIGVMCGEISGNVVCVDLDSKIALELADAFLPKTSMIDGRPSKPRSHRWYVVREVPPTLTSTCDSAKALGGGPKIVHYPAPAKIDILGTGAQAAIPPSIHPSGERREWQSGVMGSPRIIDCHALYACVHELAVACGWKEPTAPPLPRRPWKQPSGDAVDLARDYLRRKAPAVAGAHGHNTLMSAVRRVVSGFNIDPETAFALLAEEYNPRCLPPWSERELRHKIVDVLRTSCPQASGGTR